MILTPEALRRRITRAQALVAYLDRLKPVEAAVYENDIALQLRIERVAQLLTRAFADVAETLREHQRRYDDKPANPFDPATLVAELVADGVFAPELAGRLEDLPELALVLAHEHHEIDPRAVWTLWHHRRRDIAAAFAAFAAHLNKNRTRLQL